MPEVAAAMETRGSRGDFINVIKREGFDDE